jgi:hypothetical protein
MSDGGGGLRFITQLANETKVTVDSGNQARTFSYIIGSLEYNNYDQPSGKAKHIQF